MPDDYMSDAHRGNPDGIGVMSKMGVEKFVGRKALKRARRYIRQLTNGNIEHAIHFRYATHGDVTRANCHPFTLPNGNGWLMHNGVLADYIRFATNERSDTSFYAATHTQLAASDDPDNYWYAQSFMIGSNKLCVMLPDYSFKLVNESLGDWIDGIWYSQTYSLYAVRWERYSVGSYESRWTNYSKTPTSTYRTAGDEQWEVFNPITGQYEPRLGDPSTERLRLAYDRKDAESTPWDAWNRDRDGNDPLPEDIALDAELAKHLDCCCDFCGMDGALNEHRICETCETELADEGQTMEWMSNSRRVQS
jgi:predicted glutamine amidotransferase